MRGSSRTSAAEGEKALQGVLSGGADAASLAEDLFGATAAIDSSATLRRALTDPSRSGEAKSGLVERLFGGKISAPAVDLLKNLVSNRWSTDRDFSDTLESFAVTAVLAGAESSGRIDAVEDELFRFERIVSGNAGLRDALTDRNAPVQAKATVISTLLDGKVAAETVRLARQAVLAPRGRKLDRIMEGYLALAAKRRDQLTAVVTSAVPLDQAQRERLAAALQGIYGKTVLLQGVTDEKVMGGIRVQIGDEVVDGTVLRKLEAARRHLAG